MPTVPVDGRRQFSQLDVVIANSQLAISQPGRMPLAGVSKIGPDMYVEAGSWPVPRTVSTGPSSARPEPQPETPKTPASALWPHLPTGGANG
jgi:hypothetical protein